MIKHRKFDIVIGIIKYLMVSGIFFIIEHHRNPQTEALLKFLELPYLLDNSIARNEPSSYSPSVSKAGNHS